MRNSNSLNALFNEIFTTLSPHCRNQKKKNFVFIKFICWWKKIFQYLNVLSNFIWPLIDVYSANFFSVFGVDTRKLNYKKKFSIGRNKNKKEKIKELFLFEIFILSISVGISVI